jgi:L-ribulose-5-phosphate 4-epimerase|tara:strand:+ start:1809 stop:2507 length:699 start_codon:yes stop_codon:yes gene_type:complete
MEKKLDNFFKECKKQNIILVNKKLSIQTFSNVSIRIDKDYFTIKPSGVIPKKINLKDCPVIRIKDGKKIKGKYRPSTDTPTHQILYKNFKELKSISHTHSKFATAWAQSGKEIPLYGTTHSDYWASSVPVTRFIKKKELKFYEKNTGNIIVECLNKKKLTTKTCPGILVPGHGTFCWGDEFDKAVNFSEMLEFVAELAYYSQRIKFNKRLPDYISKKHFERKFGKKRYYGQK